MKTKLTLIVSMLTLLALLCLSGGCVKTQVETGSVKFATTRFLWAGNVSEASITTNGMSLKGYNSDPASLVEAAVRGAVSAAKPIP